MKTLEVGRKENNQTSARVVHVVYRDHVLYNQMDPKLMSPQTRECLGWLVMEESDFIVISWDRNVVPPILKGGDSKAGGLVILRADILEMKKIG